MPARLIRAILDPGWLFVGAGLALIASAVLIPAIDAAEHVRQQRERAIAIESHRLERIRRHEAFLAALDLGDPDLLHALALTQLHPARGSPTPLLPPDPARADASVFDQLEPPPVRLVAHAPPDSLLYRLTTTPRLRAWVIAGGTLCLLLGLLPPSRPPSAPIPPAR